SRQPAAPPAADTPLVSKADNSLHRLQSRQLSAPPAEPIILCTASRADNPLPCQQPIPPLFRKPTILCSASSQYPYLSNEKAYPDKPGLPLRLNAWIKAYEREETLQETGEDSKPIRVEEDKRATRKRR
ncbi:hypothetical protein BU26DRAFT_608467, partial [Trematosphaeria pertusa]